MAQALKALLAIGACALATGTAGASTVISHTFDAPGTGAYTTVDGYTYGAGVDAVSFPTGNALYFKGNNASRSVTFAPVDLSNGGNVSFAFIIGNYSTTNQAYFEGADGFNEDVSFAYSTNGGTSWSNLDTYSPADKHSGTRSISGWTNINYTLAANASLASTTFRLLQSSNSGSCCDHWAIDNLLVTSNGAVPEPASWAMMILGMGAVGFAMRRRQRTVTTTLAYAA